MVKFIRKIVLEKVSTCGAFIQIDPCEKNNQKQISDVDLGFAINQEISSLKKVNKRVNDGMIFQFKKEEVAFLSTICSHHMTKSPVTSYFAQCLLCLSPCYMAECTESVISCLVNY